MSRDSSWIADIVDAAQLALSYVREKSYEEFCRDIQCQDAVIRRLEIIGEAARRISATTQEAMSQIPWHALTGMRNVMIHQYDGVDLRMVWETLQRDLPALIVQLGGPSV